METEKRGNRMTVEKKKLPIVAMNFMTDRKWHELCLRSRVDHPKYYAKLGEDVEAVKERLRVKLYSKEAVKQ